MAESIPAAELDLAEQIENLMLYAPDSGRTQADAAESMRKRAAALVRAAARQPDPDAGRLRAALMDELSEEWTSVERAIWPDGPAHGHGSGAYAALKARIIAVLRQ